MHLYPHISQGVLPLNYPDARLSSVHMPPPPPRMQPLLQAAAAGGGRSGGTSTTTTDALSAAGLPLGGAPHESLLGRAAGRRKRRDAEQHNSGSVRGRRSRRLTTPYTVDGHVSHHLARRSRAISVVRRENLLMLRSKSRDARRRGGERALSARAVTECFGLSWASRIGPDARASSRPAGPDGQLLRPSPHPPGASRALRCMSVPGGKHFSRGRSGMVRTAGSSPRCGRRRRRWPTCR